jgi:hypothetical protein
LIMPDSVTVPAFGKQKKKTVILVGSGVVVVLGYAYYRARQAKAAAATATANTAQQVDQNQIDPSTGYPYGSALDASGLAASASYVDPASYGGGGGYGGSTYYPGSSGTNTTVTQFVSNPQWAQAAEDYLGNVAGLPIADVSAAMGKYLTGADVTPTQRSYIEQAIAAMGLPPVGGVNGYPPYIKDGATVVTPPAAPGAGMLNGSQYYYNVSDGGVYTVSAGKRYHVTPATWAKLRTQFAPGQSPHKEITSADPIMHLPNGGNI